MYLKFDEFLQLIYLYNRHQLYANNNNSLRLNGFQYRFVTICRLINFNSFYCDKWRNKVLSYKTKCFRNEFVIPMQYAEHAFQTKTDNVFINTFHLISLGFVYVVQAVTLLQRLCSNYSGKLAGACKILVESSCDTTSNLVVSTGSAERWNMDNKISYSAVHFKRNVIYLKRMGRLKLRETARTLSMGNVCRRAPRWDNNAVKK